METILFRTSAMLQSDKRMVLNFENEALPLEVPSLKGSSTRELHGTIGCNVFVAHSVEEGRPPPPR